MSRGNVPEVAASPAARQALESTTLREEIQTLQSASLVDYRRTIALKRRVLEELTKSFFSAPSSRRVAFESYVANHPRLGDYAHFRAMTERLKTPGSEWPALSRDDSEKQTPELESQRYHMYVQWLAEEQLQGAADRDGGSGLYLDLPLGVNANGYDVWREQSLFASGVAGGCPPDIVFPEGQNWGFVPLHPENIRTQGYGYVREYLRHQMRFAKVLRIDHMGSFHRVYWIPPGAPASEGVYVRYPAEELYAVFSLESHRHKTMLVGEDLGTVPAEVPQSMARHNVHRMYVVQYELKPDRTASLPEPPASSVASLNTHDMPPFAGFWQGKDLEERESAGLLSVDKRGDEDVARDQLRVALHSFFRAGNYVDAEQPDAAEIFRACLAYLRDSPARMVLVNLEDLWGETKSQNIPSTSDTSSNWTKKALYSLEEFSRDGSILEILHGLNRGFP